MKHISSICACALAGAAMGCVPEPSDPGDIPAEASTGEVRLELGSQPPEDLDPRVEGVFVRVESVEIRHETEGWLDLSSERMDIDLMAAEPTVIAEDEVYAGAYDRMEIGIADAWIVVDGVEENLMFLGDVDPNEPLSMGLVVTDTFFVEEDMQTTVNIDWDVDENVKPRGDGWSLGASTALDSEVGEVVEPGGEPGAEEPREEPGGEEPGAGE